MADAISAVAAVWTGIAVFPRLADAISAVAAVGRTHALFAGLADTVSAGVAVGADIGVFPWVAGAVVITVAVFINRPIAVIIKTVAANLLCTGIDIWIGVIAVPIADFKAI